MTIHIDRRKVLVAFRAVIMISAACYIAFLVGQTSRITEADAETRTKTAVERMVKQVRMQEAVTLAAEIKKTKTAARNHEARRVKRLNRRWKRRLARETVQARQQGVNSGYASGQSDGFQSGQEEGEEEGFENGLDAGSDELTCSDDADIYWLPPCF